MSNFNETNQPLDALDAAAFFGSGYRDGELGADRRDMAARRGLQAQQEYLLGYEQGAEQAVRYEL